jgi:hypothetical protein
VRSRLTWFEQIDGWCNARPIVERLGPMRRLDRCLLCELSDAPCDVEYARDLLGRQLELAKRSRQQALACRIQRVGRSWLAACLGCASDQLLIWLATPTAPVSHELLDGGGG